MSDDEFDVRPGRGRDGGSGAYRKADRLVGRVVQASRRAGITPLRRDGRSGGTGRHGRGRLAARRSAAGAFQRRVIVKARVVRHRGARFRSAPLARHMVYLERDGTTRDGAAGSVFDAGSDRVDATAFAARCEEDRHHFRFIVAPEDAGELEDLRAFTRDLIGDMARDLGTHLDWVAIDHWNTANPHVHILIRGVADNGGDLVIDRDYVREGLRSRAAERATVELGPRGERAIEKALRWEVGAERWTGLDRQLQRLSDDRGAVELSPAAGRYQRGHRTLLIGRARVLERMGLAERIGPESWRLAPGIECTLRDMGERGDVIKTMHRAMTGEGRRIDPARFILHGSPDGERVTGRLVERGLHDELSGEAYAIIDGVDGRAHYLRFPDIERTGDAPPGAVVEAAGWKDRKGRDQMSLAIRSDIPIERQVEAHGATWLDRQLLSPRPEALGGGFGDEVRRALAEREARLVGQGFGVHHKGRVTFTDNLLANLQERELAGCAERLSSRTGLAWLRVFRGDQVAGVYRERVTLASGRFAMIDNGMGFQLVPWRQDLERHLGQQINGRVGERGGVDWTFARARGPAI